MRVRINDETRDVADRSTLSDLIAELALAPQRIAVEVNQQIVRRNDWARTVLNDGDRIEIVHFVGGGATGRRMQTADEMRSSRNFRLIVNRCKVITS